MSHIIEKYSDIKDYLAENEKNKSKITKYLFDLYDISKDNERKQRDIVTLFKQIGNFINLEMMSLVEANKYLEHMKGIDFVIYKYRFSLGPWSTELGQQSGYYHLNIASRLKNIIKTHKFMIQDEDKLKKFAESELKIQDLSEQEKLIDIMIAKDKNYTKVIIFVLIVLSILSFFTLVIILYLIVSIIYSVRWKSGRGFGWPWFAIKSLFRQ